MPTTGQGNCEKCADIQIQCTDNYYIKIVRMRVVGTDYAGPCAHGLDRAWPYVLACRCRVAVLSQLRMRCPQPASFDLLNIYSTYLTSTRSIKHSTHLNIYVAYVPYALYYIYVYGGVPGNPHSYPRKGGSMV